MKYILHVVVAITLLTTQVSAEPAEPIRIGWTGPLSGNSAVLGIDSVQAAKIVVDETNAQGGIGGRQVELINEDDQYDTAKAVSAYTKLVSQGVVAIIASSYGGVFATADRAVRDKVLIINPLDCNNDIAKLGENTFCIATESESIGRVISDDIAAKHFDPVAVIYDEKNPFMVLVQSVIKKNHGRDESSYFVGLDQSSADFKSVLLKLRARGVKSLVLLGHDPMGQAMREARALGVTAQFYTVGTITSPGYQQLAGDAANGTLVAYWEAPRSKDYDFFIEKFQAKVGRPPILELATIPTYDTTKILISAIESATNNADRPDINAIKKFIYGLKNHPGLSGNITMDSDGAVRSVRESIYTFEGENLKISK